MSVYVSRLNAVKATQAAAVLLEEAPGKSWQHLKVLKQLYIAERTSWAERGGPILCDLVLAMPLGPVCEGVYDLIRGDHADSTYWGDHIQRVFIATPSGVRPKTKNGLCLVKSPGGGKLSEYEVDLLRRVAKETASQDPFELSRKSHEFPEWIENYNEDTSTQIPLASIIRAAGRGAQVEELVAKELYYEEVDRLFSGPQGEFAAA